jgi:hypothetical protein
VNAIVQTANALTLTAQPSPTFTAFATETFTVTSVLPTFPPPNTDTATAPAASGPANLAATSTPTLVSGQPTASATLGIRTYGTLPPQNRPYTTITLINKAKREAYISLQVVTDQGYTIIEYPVKSVVKVKIPVGYYTYVAWVGGRQFVGYFHVSKDQAPTIIMLKDKIEVRQSSGPASP